MQVLNGSGAAGLAALTGDTIRNANLGYTVLDAGNAARASTTTVYYKPGFKVTAAYLQSKLFPDATVKAGHPRARSRRISPLCSGADYAASAA